MIDHVLAAYTFSKSYSMSGWRIGFALGHPELVEAIGTLINTTASCSPPFVQLAAMAAMESDAPTRDDYMARFRSKVDRLVRGLSAIDGIEDLCVVGSPVIKQVWTLIMGPPPDRPLLRYVNENFEVDRVFPSTPYDSLSVSIRASGPGS